MWKWNLHTGYEVEAMRRDTGAVEWEEALVEGRKAEAGLHYGDKSNSMRKHRIQMGAIGLSLEHKSQEWEEG